MHIRMHPYSPNEVNFEKKGEKNLLWPHIAEILPYHYGKSSNYYPVLDIKKRNHEFSNSPIHEFKLLHLKRAF